MQLPAQIRAAIEAHTASCHPEEACGLLAGDAVAPMRWAYCLTNVEHAPDRFTIDPDEHFAALRDAEQRGWEITGSFHSHPASPPYPSPADVTGALDPRWFHLIAAPADGGRLEIRAFHIAAGGITEVDLEEEVP